ncbi:hypothetical protein [Streptomyces sp. NPDC000880]
MDYLDSAVAGLTEGATPPGERHLKYAVLHLQAATEVLLKARLIGEHWSLVYRRVGDADLGKFKRGDFESCNTDETIDRLTKIAQVEIPARSREAIRKLAEDRNALMHYGHTGSAYVIEARAAEVLSFLLEFINEELRPMLDRQYEEAVEALSRATAVTHGPIAASALRERSAVDETMAELRLKLGRIEKLVDKRMKDLAGDLSSLKHRTIHCPECRQMAFVVNEDGTKTSVSCRFCLCSYESPDLAAVEYFYRVIGKDNGKVTECPVCKVLCLVLGATVAADRYEELALCFNCNASFALNPDDDEQDTSELGKDQ